MSDRYSRMMVSATPWSPGKYRFDQEGMVVYPDATLRELDTHHRHQFELRSARLDPETKTLFDVDGDRSVDHLVLLTNTVRIGYDGNVILTGFVENDRTGNFSYWEWYQEEHDEDWVEDHRNRVIGSYLPILDRELNL